MTITTIQCGKQVLRRQIRQQDGNSAAGESIGRGSVRLRGRVAPADERGVGHF